MTTIAYHQAPRFQFGFIVTTLAGNATRYRILRKYAERDPDVECTWAPVQQYYRTDEHDPVRFVPPPLHSRAVPLAQAWPVLSKVADLDAVMLHQLESATLLGARGLFKRWPLLINSADNPPVIDPDTYPLYPDQRGKPRWRSRLRLLNDIWSARRAGYFIGFSEWSADILRKCGLRPEHVKAQHVGLDLEQWPAPPERPPEMRRPRLLFVGADFERKNGRLLLQIYEESFQDRCDLEIVTKSDLGPVPPGVRVWRDLNGSDARLLALYQHSDIFVLPSDADLVPWVVLEAMASGCAVIASNVGGIPDCVPSEAGILFDPGSPQSLRDAIEALIGDSARVRAMAKAGRAHVEEHFDAAVNVPRMLNIMKTWVEERRAGRS